jgi:hypothetical protein
LGERSCGKTQAASGNDSQVRRVAFAPVLGNGAAWSVAITVQPAGQTWAPAITSGLIANVDVALAITCSDDTGVPGAPLTVFRPAHRAPARIDPAAWAERGFAAWC